jgi:hypothetical protein
MAEGKVHRPFNPIRGTIWLPAEIRLNEIDWSPLPEARPRAHEPLFAPEEGRVAA